ncbi:MAG: hypothetical protein OEV43_00775 [Coriobacteriia bacterium]|nr:hypothetical protein [Coriobacteriia bacterium]
MSRTRVLGILLIAALLLSGLGLVGCLSEMKIGGYDTSDSDEDDKDAGDSGDAAAFAVGESVAALWDDGNFYLANVTDVDDREVVVRYADDGSSKTVPVTDVREIPNKVWRVGDRVLAVWYMGRFYPGEVIAVDGDTHTIAWDDGSEPSEVESGKIIAEE